MFNTNAVHHNLIMESLSLPQWLILSKNIAFSRGPLEAEVSGVFCTAVCFPPRHGMSLC